MATTTTRRSSRLANLPAPGLVDNKQVTSTEVVVRGNVKATIPAVQQETRQSLTNKEAKRRKVEANGKSAPRQGNAPGVLLQASPLGAKDKISSLPPEVFRIIQDNIKDPKAMSLLGRTSKRLYSLMMPQLYGRIAVAAMFHAHIPKLIRTVEPLLSISQKKQLKREGKYRGQQEKYRTGLDEKAKPACANYVRQLVVGRMDPGRKHKYICDRYVEEAFKNMENLEIVETWILTESICQSLASLKHLKALHVLISEANAEDLAPLGSIKNLKHLKVDQHSYLHLNGNVFQSVLQNSTSTLQSLDIHSDGYSSHPLEDWNKNMDRSNTSTRGDGHDFVALKYLALRRVRIDADFIKEFNKAINFAQLRHLNLEGLTDSDCLLLPYLTSQATSHQGTNRLNLRRLELEMRDFDNMDSAEHSKVLFDARCRFISSFDTLTTLELQDVGLYPSNTMANPGLPDVLLQAILKHKDLRVLRIHYFGTSSHYEIPYLNAKTVKAIVEGLPQLQELEFAPDEAQMEGIGQALCRSRHLESITCFPVANWGTDDSSDNTLSSILSSFLVNPGINLTHTSTHEKFVWEDHYRLKRVSIPHKRWDIGSKFEKQKRKGKQAMPVKVVKKEAIDGSREVFYRQVPHDWHIHVGYDPEFVWVEKADKEML